MTAFILAIAGKSVAGIATEWFALAAAPVIYLISKKRIPGFLQKLLIRFLSKNKRVGDHSNHLLLSVLLASGIGLIFGFLSSWLLGLILAALFFLILHLTVFNSHPG